ncbi:MAG: DUF177 domain-containing protein [Bacteroidota bacterium]
MSELKHYTLPLRGLRDGMHTFDFEVDNHFFRHFEASPIKEGVFTVQLFFDKRPDLIVMTFQMDGKFQTACDRCLNPIYLPIRDSHQLMVKFSETPSEEAEVVFIPPGSTELNVAKFIYEYICLSMPMVKIYDCESEENPPCNFKMLQYLEPETNSESEDQQDEEKNDNPIWDALKNFKKD